MMRIISRPLPRRCHPNRQLASVDGAVIHFISDRYRHPDDPFNFEYIFELLSELGYSYNLVIPREGDPIELVPAGREAWHAGRSRWKGRDWCNRYMHGVALVGGTGFDYTDSQMTHLAQWLAEDMTRNGYDLDMIAGHDQVREEWNTTHPDKADKPKHDPGPLFDWDQLREMLGGVDYANTVRRP